MSDHVPDGHVRSRIRVFGAQSASEISKLRRQAAVTVVASRYETFAMTVVEAFAYGAPLVASDAGALPEVVRNGETGLAFCSGDSLDLATKLIQLLGSPSLCQKLGAGGRAEYEARFSPVVVARRMSDFYREVVARGRRAHARIVR
jgi:glycosyltransferase involved in cell wall biosynthesis